MGFGYENIYARQAFQLRAELEAAEKRERLALADCIALSAENAWLREALEGLTNAALAELKPLPSQVELAFEVLKNSGNESVTKKSGEVNDGS